MRLVKNSKKYWEFIRHLRNDNDIKSGFIEQNYIEKEEHFRFMKEHGHNYYICLDEAKPVGFVGAICGDIRIAVDKNYHSKGIGKFMLKEFLESAGDIKVYAKVKIENLASLNLFKGVGFIEKYYIMELALNEK